MVSNSMLVASSSSSLYSPSLFAPHKLSSSFKTISKQSHTFLHTNPTLLRHVSFGSNRPLSSVCFFNARDKSNPKFQDKALAFSPFFFLFLFSYALTFRNSSFKLSCELLSGELEFPCLLS